MICGTSLEVPGIVPSRCLKHFFSNCGFFIFDTPYCVYIFCLSAISIICFTKLMGIVQNDYHFCNQWMHRDTDRGLLFGVAESSNMVCIWVFLYGKKQVPRKFKKLAIPLLKTGSFCGTCPNKTYNTSNFNQIKWIIAILLHSIQVSNYRNLMHNMTCKKGETHPGVPKTGHTLKNGLVWVGHRSTATKVGCVLNSLTHDLQGQCGGGGGAAGGSGSGSRTGTGGSTTNAAPPPPSPKVPHRPSVSWCGILKCSKFIKKLLFFYSFSLFFFYLFPDFSYYRTEITKYDGRNGLQNSQTPWIRSYTPPGHHQYTSPINHTYYITKNTHNKQQSPHTLNHMYMYMCMQHMTHAGPCTAKKTCSYSLQLTCRKSQEASVTAQKLCQNKYICKHAEFGWQLGWSMLHVNCRHGFFPILVCLWLCTHHLIQDLHYFTHDLMAVYSCSVLFVLVRSMAFPGQHKSLIMAKLSPQAPVLLSKGQAFCPQPLPRQSLHFPHDLSPQPPLHSTQIALFFHSFPGVANAPSPHLPPRSRSVLHCAPHG
ncbi:hypothetical protein VP01_1937g2 [Puccinia sorghi]|uniref:Uncharacterized protein n=1 Tax=Puccinia sorghi TaxID=27349 RepID=A0A0L6VE66_9BASI|nr:hypothetical protein VP01_1937g2 [Puccinia sorghi]